MTEYTPPVYERKIYLSPADYPHIELNQLFTATRMEKEKHMLINTRKPRKAKPNKKTKEALKDRVESIEGSDVVETVINATGEQPIKPRLEDLPEGKTPSFQGA